MQATRQQILDYLRRNGRATVKDLDVHLGLTSTGVRQHLTVLEREGFVEAHEERGRVGRPALVYRLTETGDALYPKKYDQLANKALKAEIPLAKIVGITSKSILAKARFEANVDAEIVRSIELMEKEFASLGGG